MRTKRRGGAGRGEGEPRPINGISQLSRAERRLEQRGERAVVSQPSRLAITNVMKPPYLYTCQEGEHTVVYIQILTGHLEQMEASRAEHRGERAALYLQINQPSRSEEIMSSSAKGRASSGTPRKLINHLGQRENLGQRRKANRRISVKLIIRHRVPNKSAISSR